MDKMHLFVCPRAYAYIGVLVRSSPFLPKLLRYEYNESHQIN